MTKIEELKSLLDDITHKNNIYMNELEAYKRGLWHGCDEETRTMWILMGFTAPKDVDLNK